MSEFINLAPNRLLPKRFPPHLMKLDPQIQAVWESTWWNAIVKLGARVTIDLNIKRFAPHPISNRPQAPLSAYHPG